MNLPVAQSGLTFLIYLIAGILWLLGNMSQQKKAKKRAEEMRRRREEREREEARARKKTVKPHPLEQDLESLLGRLSGERTPAGEPESPPPLPAPAPAHADRTPPPPTRQPIAESVKTPKTDIGAMDLENSYEEMKDIEDALEISYEQIEGEVRGQTLETVRQVMVDLSPTMIDFARLPVQRMRAVDGNATPPALKKRAAFKKAILGAAILGPPVALQDPGKHER